MSDTLPGARTLVERYAEGDFFLATDRATMLGRGDGPTLTDTDLVRLSERAAAALAGGDAAFAAGVLPFDPASGVPGHLLLPTEAVTAGPAHPEVDELSRMDTGLTFGYREVPEPARHAEAVARAVSLLRHGPGRNRELRKVVLARALDVEFADPVRPEAILRNLLKDNATGYTFAAPLPGGRTLIGSTPELLLAKRGDTVVSHPHAGSLPRSADPGKDTENARRLLASAKDRAEHAVLAEAVAEALRPFCRTLHVEPEPSLAATPTMWHLGTTITGELDGREINALRLAAALHPTPAICGAPTESAREWIHTLEPFERDYYAGAVGWMDADGDGEWAVSIRCAEVRDNWLRLYAGGGIMPESQPAEELAETSAKFQTLLRAMGLELSR